MMRLRLPVISAHFERLLTFEVDTSHNFWVRVFFGVLVDQERPRARSPFLRPG